jgi:hypothetical protein
MSHKVGKLTDANAEIDPSDFHINNAAKYMTGKIHNIKGSAIKPQSNLNSPRNMEKNKIAPGKLIENSNQNLKLTGSFVSTGQTQV